MEMSDDCFMFGFIASLILTDGKKKRKKTESFDVCLSLKMIISNKPRDEVVYRASHILYVRVGGLSWFVCLPLC